MEASNFQKALEIYRTNYLEYKITGNSAYKVAYESAQTTIESYLKNLQAKIGNDASYVDKFVKQYANSNRKLTYLKNKSKQIQKEGPILQDQYEVKHRINQVSEIPVDYTPYYIKGAVIVGLAGMAALASKLA